MAVRVGATHVRTGQDRPGPGDVLHVDVRGGAAGAGGGGPRVQHRSQDEDLRVCTPSHSSFCVCLFTLEPRGRATALIAATAQAARERCVHPVRKYFDSDAFDLVCCSVI